MNEGDSEYDTANDSPSFARGIGGFMGKCICDTKVWLPIELDAELKGAAAAEGATASEFLRDMVCMRFRQKTFGELQAESRRAAILGTGSVTALQVRGEVKAS
jgi:hypothetical protein